MNLLPDWNSYYKGIFTNSIVRIRKNWIFLFRRALCKCKNFFLRIPNFLIQYNKYNHHICINALPPTPRDSSLELISGWVFRGRGCATPLPHIKVDFSKQKMAKFALFLVLLLTLIAAVNAFTPECKVCIVYITQSIWIFDYPKRLILCIWIQLQFFDCVEGVDWSSKTVYYFPTSA